MVPEGLAWTAFGGEQQSDAGALSASGVLEARAD
jgi:hypothetical protein